MKLLMIYCSRFGYKTSMRTLETVPEIDKSELFENCLVGFIDVEEKDEENASYIETKLIKNLKWAARKNETEKIVLHSFTHLSDSKADPEITKKIFDSAEERLKSSNYETNQTAFGYFMDLDIQAPGSPLTRLFKDI
ncbi:MAG: hypothetical protein GY865_19010 [candidate division Zixibacteria bacterium]|nr:hypothetical protein [candidate division Zixibacteria bacterium]